METFVDGFEFQMAYIVDIVVAVLLLISAIKGAKKGFVACVFGLIASILALAVAFFCAETILTQTDGAFGLQELLVGKLTESFSGNELMQMPLSRDGLIAALKDFKIPQFLSDMIVDSVAIEGVATETTIASYIGTTLGDFAALVITGIVLFILCKIVLALIQKLFTKAVSSIKLFGFINHLLGFVIGFAKSAISILVVIALLSVLPIEPVIELLDSTLFVGYFFHNNPINLIFSLLV